MRQFSNHVFWSVVAICVFVSSNAIAQTSSICPDKEIFAAPPFYVFSTIACEKAANDDCSEGSSELALGYVAEPETGCKDGAKCDECVEETLVGVVFTKFSDKENGTRAEYYVCEQPEEIRPKNRTTMTELGTATVNIDGEEVVFKYFDISFLYHFTPKDGELTVKYMSIPVAIKVNEDPAGAPAAIQQYEDQCDRLLVRSGLHMHEYVIFQKENDKLAFLKSDLIMLADTDPLSHH